MSNPARTCLGCRRVRPKASLVRLRRRPDGVVVVDGTRRAGGRGAYVCADAACIERVLQRGRLTHAFRTSSCEAGAELAEEVRSLCLQ
jgi:predicted RNA-binding protein YlxR (DUF448 family)